jgi:hypothetical protein
MLPAAASAILNADRPAGIPSDLPIRADGETEPVARPYLVFIERDNESLHPLMDKSQLVLELRTRADEQDDLTAAAYLAAAVDYLNANPAGLAATIAPYGLTLVKFNPVRPANTLAADRARTYEQVWNVCVKKLKS